MRIKEKENARMSQKNRMKLNIFEYKHCINDSKKKTVKTNILS